MTGEKKEWTIYQWQAALVEALKELHELQLEYVKNYRAMRDAKGSLDGHSSANAHTILDMAIQHSERKYPDMNWGVPVEGEKPNVGG